MWPGELHEGTFIALGTDPDAPCNIAQRVCLPVAAGKVLPEGSAGDLVGLHVCWCGHEA